jgi:beta-lactamase regulating signal transducer with metallopeptidase domain
MSVFDTILASWAVQSLVASALLMAGVLLVRRPVQRMFGARIAYALWALPALRLALPRIPGWDADRFRVALDVHRTVGVTFYEPAVIVGGALPALSPPPPTVPIHAASMLPLPPAPVTADDWTTLLLCLWLGGAALHFAWHLNAHRRFMRRALSDAAPVTRECGIAVLAGPRIAGPLATGLFRRLVLLPGDFTRRYSPRERRLVLAHEIAHHVRGDLVANMAALAVLSLHWFNPLAHKAWRAYRQDQELACDETVLAHEPADARADYGLAVVKSASRAYPAAACAMHPVGLLKRRLRMMGRQPGTARRSAGAALGIALVVGGLIGTASGGLAAEAVRDSRTKTVRSERNGTRHVVVDDRRITVNGRSVAPDSPEGRRIVASLPVPPTPPAPVDAPDAPRAPVAASEPAAPPAPLPPLPPTPTSSVIVQNDGRVFIDGREVSATSGEARRAQRLAEREARAATAHARVAARQGEWAARMGVAQAARASAAAERALARVNVDGLVQSAMASAGAFGGAQAACGGSGVGSRGGACVDRAAINAEVRRSLNEARAEIARSLAEGERERRQAMAEMDREMKHLGRDD